MTTKHKINHHATIIIGGGPAGLQLAYFFTKSRQDYLLLESGSAPGTFFTKFPRHRKLISINKVYTGSENPEHNLRFDWNSLLNDSSHLFKDYSHKYFPDADDLVRYLKDFGEKFELNIRFNSKVIKIDRDHVFSLHCENGDTFTCDRLIVATGLSKENIPIFSGNEFIEQYGSVSINPEDFTNQRVLIIGKGNSGFETADNLVESTAAIHMLSPRSLKLAWNTHYVGHLRAVNNSLLDTYQLKSQNTILDATIERIERDGSNLKVYFVYTHAQGQRLELVVDRVLSCAGFKFDDSIFSESCKPALCSMGKYPAQTSSWESTNIPSLYFAGTLMHMRDYRQTFSGFIHGFRYNVEALSQILLTRYRETSWEIEKLSPDVTSLQNAILDRIHESSALFQQPGFFFDVFSFDTEAMVIQHYRNMPIEYFRDQQLNSDLFYLTVSMEYGEEKHVDVFNIERVPERGDLSAFIHPVIRLFDQKHILISRHDIPEDLLNVWRIQIYLAPFNKFLKQILESRFTKIPSSM